MLPAASATHRRDFESPPGRAIVLLLAVVLLWTAGTGPGRPLHAAEGTRACTVLRVYDGDTILVGGNGPRGLVRLLGIDAPEIGKAKGRHGQPYSDQSRRHLAALVLNQSVTLEIHGRDRYGRILAVVRRDGRDINLAMIAAGLAEVYRGRTPEGFDKAPYLASEADARRSRTGMWRQGSTYVSPLRWKHP